VPRSPLLPSFLPPGHSLPSSSVSLPLSSSSRIAVARSASRCAAIGRCEAPCFPKSSCPLARALTHSECARERARTCRVTRARNTRTYARTCARARATRTDEKYAHSFAHTRTRAHTLVRRSSPPSSSIIECHRQRRHFPQKAHARPPARTHARTHVRSHARTHARTLAHYPVSYRYANYAGKASMFCHRALPAYPITDPSGRLETRVKSEDARVRSRLATHLARGFRG